ncbi:MAG: peptidase S41, partial [Gammaproteobacteria bacterium]|nr:peptidase S41 [Gammaproteobacteria bacterium]
MKQITGTVIGLGWSIALVGALVSGVAAAEEKRMLPMQELRAFAEIFGRIKQDYVEPVEDSRLLE